METPVPELQTQIAPSETTENLSAVKGLMEAVGPVRSKALAKDYSKMEGYKKFTDQRREARGVIIPGKGEVIGRDTQTAYVEEREEWKGGTKLVRRYENGAIYTSFSTDEHRGLKVEMTSHNGKIDVQTECNPWHAVKGWEPILVANTPKSELFLDGLKGVSSADAGSSRVKETLSIADGKINTRQMEITVEYGWQGKRGGTDVRKAMAMDYEFVRGGAYGGKADIAYARRGFWESASGALDGVAKRKAMLPMEGRE